MKLPAVGVTLGGDAQKPGSFTLRQDYVRSVERVGGLPLLMAVGPPERAPALLGRVQALLLTGGSDLDPAFYDQAPHPKLGPVVRERDTFELALCREALERDLPILAICRGIQVLNVATGGTLVQDIPSQIKGAVDHDSKAERWQMAHPVKVLAGTRLREILRKDVVAVNSFHHQAVRAPGSRLVVSAVCEADGVIEGLEATDRRFVVGVQWHPEGFWNHGEVFRPLFAALVVAAGGGF